MTKFKVTVRGEKESGKSTILRLLCTALQQVNDRLYPNPPPIKWTPIKEGNGNKTESIEITLGPITIPIHELLQVDYLRWIKIGEMISPYGTRFELKDNE